MIYLLALGIGFNAHFSMFIDSLIHLIDSEDSGFQFDCIDDHIETFRSIIYW